MAAEIRDSSPREEQGKPSVSDRILALVERRPGLTELEIAQTLFGPKGVQQQVNPDCRLLVGLGLVERRGEGGRIDPYTYQITDKYRRMK